MNPMTMDAQTDTRKNFVPHFLPWLLAAAALAVYLLTLNHRVSLFNLGSVAKISGWTWQPEILNPVSFLVTYPFRWLPVVSIPIALNLFSAACAALTLGLLARSVAILPQDRTEAQRKREQNPFSFLTIRSAWLPPVFAVLVCGLQLTFWENATNFMGEMLSLLPFAFVIWSLLEYRLDEREGRLFLAAFVYGASMTNDWAMVCYFPVFITAIVWVRGLSFFNPRFLERMTLCGLAGISFYLLLPLVAAISGKAPVTFWEALRFNLSSQFHVVKAFFISGTVRNTLGLLSLSSLAPVLMLSIRWRASFGDPSQIGTALTSFMFHLVHAVFLVVCVWVAFDPPFSPREEGLGLTLYYLSALSVGYYSGYFLLVFGKQPTAPLQRTRPSPFDFLNVLPMAGVWLLFILAGVGLICKNAPQLQAVNDDTFRRYTSLVEEGLPRSGGILLSDDSRRLILEQAALARDGRMKDFIPIETQLLKYPAYHKFLHRQFPQQWPDTVAASEETNGVGPLHLIGLLTTLAKTNELYYLHPSFGYYFEQFYLEPHGLVYKLKILPGDTLLPPLPDENEIAVNEAFWSQAETRAFPPIERAVAVLKPGSSRSWGGKWLAALHAAREQNPNAVVAGSFYSRSLNFWGVKMQRAGALVAAAAHFEMAEKLNPENVVAQINLQFNRSLQAGENVPVDLTKVTLDQFKLHSWDEVLNVDGPFDEPSFCLENGVGLVQGGLFRQAIAPFTRVRQLAPDNLAARLWLGQLYDSARLPYRALEAIQDVRGQPEKFSLTDTNKIQLTLIETAAYFEMKNPARAVQLLGTEISRCPTNDALLAAAAQFYLANGLFNNALAVIDRRLQLSPDDANRLFEKGYVCVQLKAYDDAIAALTRALSLQKDNEEALYFRAIAYLNSGKLDDARADYKGLSQTVTNSYRIAYGLGEIAWRKHETNEAIRNYELYLAGVNTNTDAARTIIQRLRELKGKSP